MPATYLCERDVCKLAFNIQGCLPAIQGGGGSHPEKRAEIKRELAERLNIIKSTLATFTEYVHDLHMQPVVNREEPIPAL